MKNKALDIDYSDLHWGKYDCAIAQYIEVQVMGNGDFGDDEWSDGQGNGWARFGRRIQSWNDQGFVACDTYATEAEARQVAEDALAEIERLQDEVCREQHCQPDEHGAYDTDGSTHVLGCDRDWIG